MVLKNNDNSETRNYCSYPNNNNNISKFIFRIPNTHEKHKLCKYYKNVKEKKESEDFGYDLHFLCALNLAEIIESMIYIESEEKREIIERFTNILSKTYAIE